MSTGITRPIKATLCTKCLFEKMKEKSHNKLSCCKKYLLKYIHINIADFSPVASYNSCQY